jgi:hypothetical protein
MAVGMCDFAEFSFFLCRVNFRTLLMSRSARSFARSEFHQRRCIIQYAFLWVCE